MVEFWRPNENGLEGVVVPAVELLPNKFAEGGLLAALLPRPKTEPVAGALFSDDPVFAPLSSGLPNEKGDGALEVAAPPKRPELLAPDVAPPPNKPPGAAPVLAAPPKLGVDVPDPGLEPC